MIEATMADMRKSIDFFSKNEIIHLFNGRKKEEVGFFVPKVFKDEFYKFVNNLEKKQKIELLKRVAKAQQKDPIEEGGSDDGIA